MKADFQAKREAKQAEILAKFYTNKDGKLDDTEKAAMRDARATEAFSKLDTNKDGQLSLDEFKAGRAKMGMHRHARGRFPLGMRKGISAGSKGLRLGRRRARVVGELEGPVLEGGRGATRAMLPAMSFRRVPPLAVAFALIAAALLAALFAARRAVAGAVGAARGSGATGQRPRATVIEVEPIEADELRRSATGSLALGGIAAFVLLGVAIAIVRRDLRRRAEAEAREREKR